MVECVGCHVKGRDGLKAKRWNLCVTCTRKKRARDVIRRADPDNDPIKYTLTDIANAYLDALEGRDLDIDLERDIEAYSAEQSAEQIAEASRFGATRKRKTD